MTNPGTSPFSPLDLDRVSLDSKESKRISFVTKENPRTESIALEMITMASQRERILPRSEIEIDCNLISDEMKPYYGCKVIRKEETRRPPVNVNVKRQPVRNSNSVPKPISQILSLVPICVVLDLDETLVHTFDPSKKLSDGTRDAIKKEYRDLPSYYSFKCDDGSVFEGLTRPHLQEFLDTVFDIAYPQFVFTAGSKLYADEICDIIFKKRRPTKVYNRDDCHEDYRLKKPIRRIFKEFPDMVRDGRVLVVDDKQDVYYGNDHGSVFKIHPWYGKDVNDSHLLEVRRLLLELSSHSRSVTESPSFESMFNKLIYTSKK